MSTNNICFCGEIRKILCGYPLLSVAMLFMIFCLYETFTLFWAKSADDKLMIFLLRKLFSKKIDWIFLCKLSPLEKICIK